MTAKWIKPAAMLCLVAILSGCSLFGKKKLEIDGERIDVIKEDASLAPDYAAGELKIVLPAPYTCLLYTSPSPRD